MNGFEYNELVEQLQDNNLAIVTNCQDVFDIGGVRDAEWMVLSEQEFIDLVTVLETVHVIRGNGSEEFVSRAQDLAFKVGTDAIVNETAGEVYTGLEDITLALLPGRGGEETYWVIMFHDAEDDWDN